MTIFIAKGSDILQGKNTLMPCDKMESVINCDYNEKIGIVKNILLLILILKIFPNFCPDLVILAHVSNYECIMPMSWLMLPVIVLARRWQSDWLVSEDSWYSTHSLISSGNTVLTCRLKHSSSVWLHAVLYQMGCPLLPRSLATEASPHTHGILHPPCKLKTEKNKLSKECSSDGLSM
jgi:hypothetical protein